MSGEQRDRGLNAARGVAVISILIAQLTPGSGPFEVLEFSEFLAPALLAVLIGMTAQVAREHGAGALVNVLWGAALLVFGAIISLVPNDIVAILGYLGCVAVLTAALVRISVPLLVLLGAGLLAFAPWATVRVDRLQHGHSFGLGGSWADRRLLDLVEVFAGDSPYRVLALTFYAVAGVLLARMVATPRAHGMVVGGAVVLAMGVNAVDQVGGPQLRFGSGTVQDLLFSVLVAVAIAAAGHWAGSEPRGPTGLLADTLADVGGMWLSLYVLLVLGTAGHLWVDPLAGEDRSWLILGVALVGAVTLAAVWVRLFTGTRLEQGPLEGALETLAGREPTLRSTSPISGPADQSLRRRT